MDFNDLACPICHRIGQNTQEPFGLVIGDKQYPMNNLEIICKCGHVIKIVEDYKNV